MKKISLFLLTAIALLTSDVVAKPKKVKQPQFFVVMVWHGEDLKVYELSDPEDARFIAEEHKNRGNKVVTFKGLPKRIYLGCALGYFLLENHPKIRLDLLSKDIKKACGNCTPLNCDLNRSQALEFLEKGGAREVKVELEKAYKVIEREESQ